SSRSRRSGPSCSCHRHPLLDRGEQVVVAAAGRFVSELVDLGLVDAFEAHGSCHRSEDGEGVAVVPGQLHLDVWVLDLCVHRSTPSMLRSSSAANRAILSAFSTRFSTGLSSPSIAATIPPRFPAGIIFNASRATSSRRDQWSESIECASTSS